MNSRFVGLSDGVVQCTPTHNNIRGNGILRVRARHRREAVRARVRVQRKSNGRSLNGNKTPAATINKRRPLFYLELVIIILKYFSFIKYF